MCPSVNLPLACLLISFVPVDSPLEPPADDLAAAATDEADLEQEEQTAVDDAPDTAAQNDEAKEQGTKAPEESERQSLGEDEPPADDMITSEHVVVLDISEDAPRPSASEDEKSPQQDAVTDPVAESQTNIGNAEDVDVPPLPGEGAGNLEAGDVPPPMDGEHAEDRKVSFAPGTPEPKPTHRKKKSTKGSKGKKKRSAAPVSDVSPDVQALIDSALDDIPPPPPDPPTSSEPEVSAETEQQGLDDAPIESIPVTETPDTEEINIAEVDDGSTEPDMEVATQEQEVIHEQSLEISKAVEGVASSDDVAPPPANTEPTNAVPVEPLPGEDSALEPESVIAEPPAPPLLPPLEEKESRKRSSKKSSKKKGSKTESKEASAPPSGLGIDLPEDPPTVFIDEPGDVAEGIATENKDDVPVDPPTVEEESKQPEHIPEGGHNILEDTAAHDDVTGESEQSDKAIGEGETEDSSPDTKDEVVADAEPLIDDATPEVDANNEGVEKTTADDALSPADSGVVFEEEERDGSVSEEAIDDADDARPPESESGETEPVVSEVSEHLDDDPAEQDAIPEGDIATDITADSLVPDEEDIAIDNKVEPPGGTGDDAEAHSADPGVGGTEGDVSKDEHTDLAGNDATADAEISLTEDRGLSDESIPEATNPLAEKEQESAEPEPERNAENGGDLAEADGSNRGPAEQPATDDAADSPSGSTASEKIDELAAADASADVGGEAAPHEASPAGGETEEAVVVEKAADEESSVEETNAEAIADEGPAVEGTASVPDAGASEQVPGEAEPPSEPAGTEAQDDGVAPDEQPPAPPSPILSKTSSHGSHKSTHWDRPHTANRLKEVFEAPVALKRPHGHRTGSKDEVVHRGERKHRRHRSSEEDKERRERRRLEKKKAEAARALEQEMRKAEEDERRRARHEARRAARKAAEEEVAKIARDEARKAAERDAERRRKRRRHEREMKEIDRREQELQAELRERRSKDRERGRQDEERTSRTSREPRTSTSTTSRPPLTKVFSGESVHRTGFFVTVGGGSGGGDDRPSSRHSKEAPRSPRLERSKTSPATVAAPPENAAEGSSKTSHRSRRHTERDGDGDKTSSHRSSRHGGSGDHGRRRRPTLDEREKPRSFLGSLFKRS